MNKKAKEKGVCERKQNHSALRKVPNHVSAATSPSTPRVRKRHKSIRGKLRAEEARGGGGRGGEGRPSRRPLGECETVDAPTYLTPLPLNSPLYPYP